MIFSLETERCIMRPFTIEDAPDLFEMDSDPEVHKYLGNNPLKKMEQAEEVIKSILDQYGKFKLGRLAVIRKSDNAFLGWSGMKYEEHVRDYPYYDIGYRFNQSALGQGYASETAQAAIDHTINSLGITKICGGAHVDNIGSNRILSKIGLSLTEQFMFDGEMHNWYEKAAKS